MNRADVSPSCGKFTSELLWQALWLSQTDVAIIRQLLQQLFAHTLCQLLLDFLEPGLAVRGLGRVHLVTSDDELLDAQSVGQQSVLPGLTVLGDAGLELSGSGGDDEHAAVRLGGSGDHVLDEVTMSGSVDDGDIVLGSLKLPQSNVNGDT